LIAPSIIYKNLPLVKLHWLRCDSCGFHAGGTVCIAEHKNLPWVDGSSMIAPSIISPSKRGSISSDWR